MWWYIIIHIVNEYLCKMIDRNRGQSGQFKENQISINAVVFGCSNKTAAIYISSFVFNSFSDAVPSLSTFFHGRHFQSRSANF